MIKKLITHFNYKFQNPLTHCNFDLINVQYYGIIYLNKQEYWQ